MTDTPDTQTTIDAPIRIAEVLPRVLEAIPEAKGNMPSVYAMKDRSNGNSKNLKPCKPGEIRNPKGNPNVANHTSIRKVKALYAREGFSPEDVAKRMTGWLTMPYGKAVKRMNDDKTELFERLGISILIHATDTGDTSKLDSVLNRIIGPVIQRTESDIRSLTVTAKADGDLLRRIQHDLQAKVLTNKDTTTP